MANIEESICTAIDTIVKSSIAAAGYDKTIQAKIVSIVDSTIGSYKVSYQDSTFIAYSTDIDTTYSVGVTVYVLIPSGDFSNDKTILGSVQKLGINYVATTEGTDAYEINGISVITSDNVFELSSYGGTQIRVLYSKDYSDDENIIFVNKTDVEQYIKTSETIIVGMTVRTEIPQENRTNGNYGIIFALNFKSNSTGEIIQRYYTLDVDQMLGNPYRLTTATEQYAIFDIDNENFVEIDYISLFCKDFPYTIENPENDIYISDIYLKGATLLDNEDLNSYSLTFVTSRGTYFTASDDDSATLTIQAQVRVKGKVINNDSQSLSYYWFTENAGVSLSNLYYNSYGGQGWKCLNNYTVINSDSALVEWVPASYIWTVQKADIIAKEVKYKCAVVYDSTVLTKTITIRNLDSPYEITIESDSGTQFYFDIGSPTLTCYVNGEENENYSYSWAETTAGGTFTSLVESDEETTGQRAKGNKLYDVNISAITSFNTYTCTVYNGEDYLGTASIVILNSLEANLNSYRVVINNGSVLYKYNENGVSPASESVDNPIDIQALTFTVYDDSGQAIDAEIVSHCDIKWIVPTVDTMIKIPNSYTPIEENETTAIYEDLTSFAYEIANSYNINYTNNTIQLTVDYQDMLLTDATDLIFIKEGESGTNGTDYTCRIVPNVPDGIKAPAYPIFTQYFDAYPSTLNYQPVELNKWFRVQLWNNATKIFESTKSGVSSDDNRNITVTWEILQNKYNSSTYDNSGFFVKYDEDEEDWFFYFDGYNETRVYDYFDGNPYYSDPANIIKVTLKYNSVEYYATLPIITTFVTDNNYNIELKENTGFRYVTYTSDGRSPKYSSSTPFEIIVTTADEDVSKDLYYKWVYAGRIYYNGEWVDQDLLSSYSYSSDEETLDVNQQKVKPASSYDGQCVSTAIECIVYENYTEDENGADFTNELVRIHMPIHMLLNKYGLAMLNSWDGNSVVINEEDGGYILAPQIGAGSKENDNTFTGIVMGTVKESNATSTDIGLFGYSSGERSIFLDAETGSATFGTVGGGQIIIEPSDSKAVIQSGDYNYSTTDGTGMMIDFQTPEIKFGSGDFAVSKEGAITASAGTVGGWTIDDDSIYTGTRKDATNSIRLSSTTFSRTINGDSSDTTSLRMAFGQNFAVAYNGTMYAAAGVIGSGSYKISIGNTNYEQSNIHSGSKTSISANYTGFYVGTDGISLGRTYNYGNGYGTHSRFEVTSSGDLYARNGVFSGTLDIIDGTFAAQDSESWIYGCGLGIGENTNGYNGYNFYVDTTGDTWIQGNVTIGGLGGSTYLYSPTIYADKFNIMPENTSYTSESYKQNSNGFYLYDVTNKGVLVQCLSITHDDEKLLFTADSLAFQYVTWSFETSVFQGGSINVTSGTTLFTGNTVYFENGVTVDFSDATVTGLDIDATAVFG